MLVTLLVMVDFSRFPIPRKQEKRNNRHISMTQANLSRKLPGAPNRGLSSLQPEFDVLRVRIGRTRASNYILEARMRTRRTGVAEALSGGEKEHRFRETCPRSNYSYCCCSRDCFVLRTGSLDLERTVV